MNCQDVDGLLDPYSDGELDLVRHLEVEKHLSECPACADRESRLRSLRAAVSSPSLYHRAPASLRARLPQAALPAVRRPRRPRVWLAALAASVLLIGLAGLLVLQARSSAEDRFAERVVVGHIRSLQAEHATDVISSDRHTVKPWFQGKLDFSPQVPDLAEHAFPLTGGRLDYLLDRPVAALVYHRRLHPINVFIWPASDANEGAVRSLNRQGYHLRHWQRSGMSYWVISDLGDPELDDFVRLFQEHTPTANP